MAVSDEFVEYVVEQLSDWGEVSVRRMFGSQPAMDEAGDSTTS